MSLIVSPPLFENAVATAVLAGEVLETTVVTVFVEPEEPEAMIKATTAPAAAPAAVGTNVLRLLMH